MFVLDQDPHNLLKLLSMWVIDDIMNSAYMILAI